MKKIPACTSEEMHGKEGIFEALIYYHEQRIDRLDGRNHYDITEGASEDDESQILRSLQIINEAQHRLDRLSEHCDN